MAPSSEPPGNQHVGHFDLTAWRTRTDRLLVVLAHWLAARLGPHVALVATLAVAGLTVTALTGASAEIYESVSDEEGVAGLDRPVLNAVLLLRTDPLNDAVTAFTDLGGKVGMPLLATGAVLAMTVAWRHWTPVVLMIAATIGSVTMTVVGKAAVGRSRPSMLDAVPPYESSAAFPSGHSLNSIVIAGLIAYLLVRHQRTAWARATTITAAALFTVAMGLSRVYLGHHWLTDVLMAWTLGLAWLTMVIVAHRLFLTVSRSRRSGSDSHNQPAGGPAAGCTSR